MPAHDVNNDAIDFVHSLTGGTQGLQQTNLAPATIAAQKEQNKRVKSHECSGWTKEKNYANKCILRQLLLVRFQFVCVWKLIHL